MLYQDNTIVNNDKDTDHNSEINKKNEEEQGIRLSELEDINNVYIRKVLNLCKTSSSKINIARHSRIPIIIDGKIPTHISQTKSPRF